MAEYRAKRNLHIGEGTKDEHKIVKQGQVFECSTEYAEKHLVPHDLVEHPDAHDEREALAAEKEAAEHEEKAKEKRAKADSKKKGKKESKGE